MRSLTWSDWGTLSEAKTHQIFCEGSPGAGSIILANDRCFLDREVIVNDGSDERDLQNVAGDPGLLGAVLERHRDRLLRMITLRLDVRLAARLDPADVLQEAYVIAIQRLPEFLDNPQVPLFIWLRFLALQTLAAVHRRHLGVEARNAAREARLVRDAWPDASSAVLAAHLVGKLTSPSHAAMREEMKLRLQEALDQMDPINREIIALRHFEQLTNSEAARVLDLSDSATCNRYVRALERLKGLLRWADESPKFGRSQPDHEPDLETREPPR